MMGSSLKAPDVICCAVAMFPCRPPVSARRQPDGIAELAPQQTASLLTPARKFRTPLAVMTNPHGRPREGLLRHSPHQLAHACRVRDEVSFLVPEVNYQLANRPGNSCPVPCRAKCRRGHAALTRLDNDESDHRPEKKRRQSSIVEPMNPDESGFVVGVDGPEREGGDDQGRLGWRTVSNWSFIRQGLAVAQDQTPPLAPPGPGSSIDGASFPSRHDHDPPLQLQLQSRFQPHYQTRSGRPGRESSFAYHTRRDCASAVSPRNAPEPAPVCRGNGVRRLDRTRSPIDISRLPLRHSPSYPPPAVIRP